MRTRMGGTLWLGIGSVALALAATMAPADGPDHPFRTCILCGGDAVGDALANCVMLLPFGFAFGRLVRGWWKVVLAAALFSTAIELTQTYFIPGRDGDLGDILFNTCGAAIGVWLATRPRGWLVPVGRRAAVIGSTFSALALGTVTLSGYLGEPWLPATSYYGQWTPEFEGMAHYDGRVLDVRSDGRPIPSEELKDDGRLRRDLAEGGPLTIEATASSKTASLATMFSIADDRHNIILLVGVDGSDLAVTRLRRAGRARFYEPEIRAPNALAHVRAGDTVKVRFREGDRDACLGILPDVRCDLGLSPGSGWQYLVNLPAVRSRARIFNVVWLALLVAPVGYWLRGRWPVLAVIAAVCWAIPLFSHLALAPLSEAFGAFAGAVLGAATASYVSRQTTARVSPV